MSNRARYVLHHKVKNCSYKSEFFFNVYLKKLNLKILGDIFRMHLKKMCTTLFKNCTGNIYLLILNNYKIT